MMSLAIAYSLGGILAIAGVVLSLIYTGSALATTAIGTLLPVLSDTGELSTEFGTYLLAAGAVGEFGPILLLTLVLSTQDAVHNALILVAFIALAVAVACVDVEPHAADDEEERNEDAEGDGVELRVERGNLAVLQHLAGDQAGRKASEEQVQPRSEASSASANTSTTIHRTASCELFSIVRSNSGSV
jgi:hypothetical protein